MTTPRCAHCGAPVDAGRSFCCTGCEAARRLLEHLGDDVRFDALGGAPVPVPGARVDADAIARIVDTLPKEGRARVELDVEGVTCASCSWLVESVARRGAGVLDAQLNTALGRLSLDVDVGQVALEDIARQLAVLGHAVGPPLRARDVVADELIARFGVSAALSVAAMVFAFSFYFGLRADDVVGRVFSFGQLCAGALAVAIGGQPFFRGARRALVSRSLTMDVPIAAGMLAALGASVASVVTGGRGIYFDTVAIFVTLMLLGRLLERRVVENNRRLLLTHDADVKSLRIRRLDAEGLLQAVPLHALVAGDVVLLAPGELVPVDLVLDDAERRVSLAWITGEPEPRDEVRGALLPAGAHNVDGRPLRGTVRAPFSSSRLAALLAPPLARGADPFFARLARAWVVGVLVVAAVAVALWWRAGFQQTLEVLAALLVVTCPCAFGIAAPLASERAQALLRSAGLFVRSPTFLARARRLRTVVFDKTGTLTSGTLELEDTRALDALSLEQRTILAGLVAASNHPKSRAVAAALSGASAALDVVEVRGCGIGTLDGRAFFGRATGYDDDVLVLDGEVRASLRFQEQLRPGAREEVQRLRALGIELYVASGDDDARTKRVAARLGIPEERACGDLLPEEKRDRVRALDRGDLLFIGDGLNDALAFEAATCTGTPAIDRPQLPARADFFLLGGGLEAIALAVDVARRLRRVLLGLLTTATVYNAAVVTLGLAGALSPLVVAIAMPLTSVSLVAAAAFLVRAPTSPAKSAVRFRPATDAFAPASLRA